MTIQRSIKVKAASKQYLAIHDILHLEDASRFRPFFILSLDIFSGFHFHHPQLFVGIYSRLTAGVTGKGGIWRIKLPDAESASWVRFPEIAAERPHLSGARGVSPLLL
jgi:hypothetical protein